jgi:hypothetical protein
MMTNRTGIVMINGSVLTCGEAQDISNAGLISSDTCSIIQQSRISLWLYGEKEFGYTFHIFSFGFNLKSYDFRPPSVSFGFSRSFGCAYSCDSGKHCYSAGVPLHQLHQLNSTNYRGLQQLRDLLHLVWNWYLITALLTLVISL